jgi:pilus assembly protein Flp/PilA
LIEFAIAQQMKLQDMFSELMARLEREEGQDLIEYALLAALISVAVIAALVLLAPRISNTFGYISNQLNNA